MEVIYLGWENKGNQVYRKKFKPNVKKTRGQLKMAAQINKKNYTENWDGIRKKVYQRDGYRCVLCGKKGKISAHHIVPVKVSKDNSLSNLVSVCDKCHRKLEAIGLRILQEGGSRSTVRRTELTMIMESKRDRMQKYLERTKNERDRKKDDESDDTIDGTKRETIQEVKSDG